MADTVIVRGVGTQGVQGIQGPAGSGGGSGLTGVKTVLWAYPTPNGYAIQNAVDGQAISLKSSNSASLRWHIRDGGPSVAGYSPSILSINNGLTDGNIVTFNIDSQESPLPIGYHYVVNIATGDGQYNGTYISTESTTTTITLDYVVSTDSFDRTNVTGTLYLPSVYNQVEVRQDGVWIKNTNWSEPSGYVNYWNFKNDGSIGFPSNYSNSRTGYGEVLQFGNASYQSIITGPETTENNQTAQRLVIAGQDGHPGTTGEGGDIYLWAGLGGSAGGTGGDIKVDAGNGQAAGEGGTIKIRGGYSPEGIGGFVEISGGQGGTSGGRVDIYSSNGAPITLSGNGGEFLNDSSNPNNQIATIGSLPSGATGSFVSQDGKTITVTNGIITDISII